MADRREVPSRARRLLDRTTAGTPAEHNPVTYVTELPAREAQFSDWPPWVPERVINAIHCSGVERPWAHQIEAASLMWSGQDVIIATGTASGKSLAYQLPVLSTLTTDPKATALYLAPTKALAADQLGSVSEWELDGVRPAAYDGDTPRAERDWVREHARWVFTNPDMLHRGILPAHSRWSRFFRALSYVVVDECHSYRGLFGSHVALLLRRLRRIAAHYGAHPVFLLASATTAEPAEFGRRLSGTQCMPVVQDTSARGPRTVVLWEPPLSEGRPGENGTLVRRSAGAEAARILAELVIEGARTLAFVRSRRGAELTALEAQRILSEVDPELSDLVSAYRSGYLPEERRALEQDLMSGRLRGVATTNALELGVDVAGLDAVILTGYPGTLASFWQQSGRAGRSGDEALVVFVAHDDPLDTYLVHHPAALLHQPVEAAVLDPANPYVLVPQLACAAAELPLKAEELDAFGGAVARNALQTLVADQVLRRRPSGWYWTARDRPQYEVDMRSSGGEQIAVVEADTARLLGTIDPGAACRTVHPGAIYLHQGSSYVVDDLDLENGLALVHAEDPEWYTSAREVTHIAVLETAHQQRHGGVTVSLGEVAVTTQVVGYLRRLPSGAVLDHVALDLPEQVLHTRAVWYTINEELLMGENRAPGNTGIEPVRLPGALHAAEHAAIGLLPLFATCDRRDIGGVSTTMHADTGEATVFVHDGHPGGAGFADRGFAALVPWLAATREAINSCACPAGCPSCVQSPQCGNGNEPLDKAGAVTVLNMVLGALEHDVEHGHDTHQAAEEFTAATD